MCEKGGSEKWPSKNIQIFDDSFTAVKKSTCVKKVVLKMALVKYPNF